MFNFPLEAVLKIRHRKLEQAQLALAESLRAVERIRGELSALTRERERGKEEMRNRSLEGLPADEFILRRRHLNGLRVKSGQLREELVGCHRVVAQRRQELVAADKEKKMVERLKEQAYVRYGQEVKAREMKALDEFAVIRFARARRNRHA